MMLLLVWINGALVGCLVAAVYIWFQLATGKRFVHPLVRKKP